MGSNHRDSRGPAFEAGWAPCPLPSGVRPAGVEPASPAYRAGVLPLNYERLGWPARIKLAPAGSQPAVQHHYTTVTASAWNSRLRLASSAGLEPATPASETGGMSISPRGLAPGAGFAPASPGSGPGILLLDDPGSRIARERSRTSAAQGERFTGALRSRPRRAHGGAGGS